MDSTSITSIYKLVGECFASVSPVTLHEKAYVITDDLNSHSVAWNYNENDEKSTLVKMWAKPYHLSLIRTQSYLGLLLAPRGDKAIIQTLPLLIVI